MRINSPGDVLVRVHRLDKPQPHTADPAAAELHGIGADPRRRSPRLAVVYTLWVVACHIDIAPLFYPRQSVNQIGTIARNYCRALAPGIHPKEIS